jgi:hypothetical protein
MLWEKEVQARQSSLDAFFKKIDDSCLENEPQLGLSSGV